MASDTVPAHHANWLVSEGVQASPAALATCLLQFAGAKMVAIAVAIQIVLWSPAATYGVPGPVW
jgi:hypothetical protein